MEKKLILSILVLSVITNESVFAGDNQSNAIKKPLLSEQFDGQGFELQKILRESIPVEQLENDLVTPTVQEIILQKVSKLSQIQNSKYWKNFVAFCNHTGTKTATEFILAIGLVLSMEFAFPETIAVGFALHLLGRFINKHLSAIPYILRIGISSVCGYFLFRALSVALIASIDFDPFFGAAAVLSGFLASENAVNAKPILNRPVGWIKRKIKERLSKAGWNFEEKVEVNQFNVNGHVEVLIEKLDQQERRIEELSKLVTVKNQAKTTSDEAVQVVIEPVLPRNQLQTTPQAQRAMGQQTP